MASSVMTLPVEPKIPPPVIDIKTSVGEQTFNPLASNYVVSEEPIHSRKPIRIVCMGSGYSGLMMGIVYTQKLQSQNCEFIIYERNQDLGGTWFENRYPGCQCDIPAHNYAYSFEPNPDWPNYYATAPLIHDYMKKTSKKYKVDQYMKFNHEVKLAIWNEKECKWTLTIQNGDNIFQDKCDVFINAGGVLNAWKWPNLEGLTDFKGQLLHSARWDSSYDFKGKKIAVIGNGSSGIQIVPKLGPITSKLTWFIKSKIWISPAPGINEPTGNDPAIDEKLNFAPEIIQRFKTDPEFLLQYRRSLMNRRIDNFKRTTVTSDAQIRAQELYRKSMEGRLGDSEKGREIARMIIPSFPVGCRRETPGPDLLEALLEPNIDVEWDNISKITQKGILTKSGEELEFDAIVCATGFDTSFRPRFPIIGKDGADLADQWDAIPEAYLGLAVPNFPNYFAFIGPNYPITNGSLILAIQAEAIYIYNCITKLQTESIRSMVVTADANREYNEHVQSYLERTVWVGNCRSWYKRGTVDGKVVAVYSGTTFHYADALRNPRWEDFEFQRVNPRNRFAYLGNGYTRREARKGSIGDTQTLNFEDYWNMQVLPPLFE
ncbi:hypothetical protein B7463_g3286, partial [Scytalidium lignicola]